MNATAPLILVTHQLLPPTLEQLKALGEVRDIGVEGLRKGHPDLAQADALVCLLDDIVDESVLARLPRLRVIANYAVGVNNIDLGCAERQGIHVTNTPDVLTDSTADMAFALMLSAARRVPEGERLVRSGAFRGWELDLLLGVDLHHKTLGIVGYGRIGRAVARRAHGFDMQVLYTVGPGDNVEALEGDREVDLETLLRHSDFVSLHVPLTEETYHLIHADNLKWMKRNAVLVNTSRGPVIDEEALTDALVRRWIAAAGLDVYEQEPDIDPRLLGLDNVVLVPHLGSATRETRLAMGDRVVDNVARVLRGEAPANPVNKPEKPRRG
ncbi:MAG: D-glycerate dehydrogenase [Pseudomonadota bacterium]